MTESAHPPEARRLAEFVRDHSGEILGRWEARVRLLHPAQRLDRPVLLDHMPAFLQDLADYIGEIRAGHQIAPSKTYPRIHALERLDLGFDVGEVVAEYQILREVLVELIVGELAPALRSAEMPRLHAAIDLAVGESVRQYMAARERTLRALNRISEAALDQSDVLGFLNKLLAVLCETSPAVDLVKILLREGDELVVRAAVGLDPDLDREFRIRIGEGVAGKVAAERTPIETPMTEATRAEVQSDVLLARNPRVLFGIPLLHHDDLVGVALMGSTTAYEFSEEDKLLFRTMANRATAIIVQGQLLERERAALALRDQLMGILSHDLRNPLGVIKTSAQLIGGKPNLSPAQSRAVERVVSSADRIDRMIRDLLDYTRARAGLALVRRPTSLADCCREVVDAMQALHPKREFRVTVAGDTSGEWDHDRIVRLISNLVTNAVNYGSPSTPISISARATVDGVELSVHNDGKPIAAERIPSLFDAFTRGAETAQHHDGLGLGLYIVRQIAQMHGGTVAVTSRADEGTTFTVRLPRK